MRLLLLGTVLAPLCAFAACSTFSSADDPLPVDAGEDGGNVSPGDAGDAGDADVVDSGAYATAVLADTPVVYWRMNESAGTNQLSDETGHLNSLTLVGNIPRVAGLTNASNDRALSFVTSAEALTGSDALDVLEGDFSVECWVELGPIVPGQFEMIWNRYTKLGDTDDASTHRNGIFLYRNGDSIVLERNNGVAKSEVTNPAPPDNGYHQIVASHRANEIVLYVDGVQAQAASASPFPVTAGPATFALGLDHVVQSSPYVGVLDEVAVYSYPLSLEQMARHRDARTR